MLSLCESAVSFCFLLLLLHRWFVVPPPAQFPVPSISRVTPGGGSAGEEEETDCGKVYRAALKLQLNENL